MGSVLYGIYTHNPLFPCKNNVFLQILCLFQQYFKNKIVKHIIFDWPRHIEPTKTATGIQSDDRLFQFS